jgi:hypothetical protein
LNTITRVIQLHYYKDGEFDMEKDWNITLNGWEMGSIVAALGRFEHTLSAELRQAATYYIPRIGIYDTPKLIDCAEQHIDEPLRALMNPMAVKDFHDAGRCLAFNLPTASGFHAARAVEGVLADYYRAYAGSTASGPGSGTMGDYLKSLEKMVSKKGTVGPAEKTLRTLREVSKLDRNPLMHPRESLDEQEAGIFFNLATSAIMAMMREIKALQHKSSAPSLTVAATSGS